ncbi:PHD finger protein [Vitis vinifera]|uniref:PHD finger protein n=1 Tax=Vitis vinifera TaxID=29760 RepID=A0A438HGK6_VITVI|nr:PHD finger protein [Vitis vinifera]
MVVNEIRPFKRAKRRSTSDLCDFLSFPSVSGDGDGDCFAEQPFWSAVQSFLKQYGHSRFPPSLFPSLVTWQILLRVGDPADGAGVVSLDVVEEDVARSRSVYCDQCRVVGWSGHPVCRKRYHFIIRANSNPIKGSHRACTKCGNMTYLSDSSGLELKKPSSRPIRWQMELPLCKLCNTALTVDDLEDWVYHQFEDTTHLLHGVVHSNGYGHLLRVNGREGGADILSGFDIMNFWDRLCKRLAVRVSGWWFWGWFYFLLVLVAWFVFLENTSTWNVMPVWWQNQKVMFTEELPSGMEQSGDPCKTIVLIQNNFLNRKDE